MRRALLLLALLAAGCGGSQRHALGRGAAFLPVNTVAFVAADTHSDWRAFARNVLHRVPPRVERDVDEIDLAVLQGGKLVVLTHADGEWRGAPQHRSPALADAPNYQASLRALPDEAQAQAYLRGDIAAERLVAAPGQTVTALGSFGGRFRVIAHPLNEPTNAVLRYHWAAAWLTKDGLGARLRSGGLPLARSRRVRTIELLTP